jgi:hypothetical protein
MVKLLTKKTINFLRAEGPIVLRPQGVGQPLGHLEPDLVHVQDSPEPYSPERGGASVGAHFAPLEQLDQRDALLASLHFFWKA